ncbi:hypothetical protein AVEN_114348-1 [Araneus ventricosus]|uniref:RNase H type-1 domain-containing protein n=1 Tax=Araneus ventricosus TaxID=182803 RepID=A0A4Y2BZY6_ARAVE|nr:hypothetical protein AVEN_7034-1 [Araneus ventricosus]GBL96614.1 hypothetical protein AVEN_15778-1 [Araneus ventricosus]GBL96676.1 hypothetical protein AVEN_88869-1 [Araneus ventricosus]GBL96684.1 hypothetical protein AVEN_114348-1 [Araneus ventricosus]
MARRQKKVKGRILRLVRTQYSLQMVGKTAKLQYSFAGRTSGLATLNTPCNQHPSPANNHSSDNQANVQAAANPRSISTTARETCKSLITNKHIHISWVKAHVGYDRNEEADRLEKKLRSLIEYLLRL